ncbi:MAG: polysaccharide biosynthesis C-terminal domain-containing protein [Flavobacteriales bacterium]|nr:polysaccharide biosynthesis C-terminal domain-containing protein [Flavobacteriales bacterium]
MQRSFLTNLFLLLALNLLVKPFYILGIDAGVQRAVGAEAYGGYAALLSLGFLLNIVLDLGITNYNTRHIARHTPLMGKYLGGVAAMRGGLMLAYAVLTLCTAIALGYRGASLGMLGWLVLNQALVASILYLRSNIAGAQRFRQDSVLSVLDRALLIGAVGWLLWGRSGGAPFRIEWFVWAQTGAYAITLLVALLLVRRLSGPVRVAWKPAFGWVVMKRSFPFALLILLMTFYYRIDTVMIERLLPDGAVQAGIYYQGFRWFEALNMLGYLVAGLLLPMFSRLLQQRADVSSLAGLAFKLVMAGALGVAVFGSMHAREVMALLYSEHLAEATPVFALLLWSFVAVGATYVFGTLLTAGGELRALNWMAGCGALLNIALNAFLIPRWQAEGAAWAALITQVLTAAAQVVLAIRLQRVRGIVEILIRAAVLAGSMLALAFWLDRMELSLILSFGLFGAISLALAAATGLLRWTDLRAAWLDRG